jgi:beta-fructofuranosidase
MLARGAGSLGQSAEPTAQDISLEMRLAADPRRPQYHLLPAANWMNDPNGPIFWDGRYHMFYQYNPGGAVWGDMHWGHAVSPDTVHWKHLPIALSPTAGGPDAAGCFSGTSVVDRGVVTVLYTGVVSVPEDQATIRDGTHSFRESQCLATSTDPELKIWSKMPAAVIATPPADLQVTGFRDPSPWRRGDSWYMTVGSGTPHQGGEVLLYRSRDLRQWDYQHLIAHGTGTGEAAPNPVASGDMWECPDLFPLDGRHVLIYSSQGKVHWQSGHLDDSTMVFHPEQFGTLDHGAYYAAKSQLDDHGNRILWGWIPETRPVAEYQAAGWACMMSLPRVLSLDEDGLLRMEFSPAVHNLRRREQVCEVRTNDKKRAAKLDAISIENACGEVHCVLRRGSEPLTLSLRGKLPQAEIPDPLMRLHVSPNQVSVDGELFAVPNSGPNRDPNELEMHIYVDGSVAEIILNRATAYTKRFYYKGSQAPSVTLCIEGHPDALHVSMWQIAPISPDRLTR